jgi:hypothetical protein
VFLTACWPTQPVVNNGVITVPDQKSEFPFPVKEPETYQAEVVVATGGIEDRFFIARKGDLWRRDHFDSGKRVITEMRSTDGVYLIDHRKKVYAIEPAAGRDVAGFDPKSVSFFRGKEYREFDEIEHDGGLIRYQGRKGETSQDDILISVDETSGMIVREEFTSPAGDGFVYELKGLKLEADDALFQIPAGYRKVKLDEIRPAVIKK